MVERTVAIIGAGGNIGSHLVPHAGRMPDVRRVILVEPDIYQQHNLVSQDLEARDVGRALRLSRATRAGIVWINTYRVVSPIAEFGGFKDSGFGRESGFQAIYDYTRPKTVWINTSPDPIADPFVMR